MAVYRYLPAGGVDSPLIDWKVADLSAGTVYGTSAIVTARTSTSLTIDPGENASSYIDNSPNNMSDYWWASDTVDLSDWDSSTPALLAIDVIRGDSAPSHGTIIGGAFSSAADPTGASAFSGVYIRRKTNGDADGWAINNFGQLGGYSSTFANRQRVTMIMLIDSDRLEALSYRSRFLDKDGNSGNNQQTIISSATPGAFDITGGLWFSVIAGSYQPNATPDAPSAHTPITVRYAVIPFGVNPT